MSKPQYLRNPLIKSSAVYAMIRLPDGTTYGSKFDSIADVKAKEKEGCTIISVEPFFDDFSRSE